MDNRYTFKGEGKFDVFYCGGVVMTCRTAEHAAKRQAEYDSMVQPGKAAKATKAA